MHFREEEEEEKERLLGYPGRRDSLIYVKAKKLPSLYEKFLQRSRGCEITVRGISHKIPTVREKKI